MKSITNKNSNKSLPVIFAGAILMLAAQGVLAGQTFTVTNTNDSGTGSLREAIELANANPGLDLIAFNIPGSGPHTIQRLTPFPKITDPVTIDGYTQPGAAPATHSSPAALLIELDGANVRGSHWGTGLTIYTRNSTVRGLVINRFSDAGIHIEDHVGGNIIEGNYIGTDVTGALGRGSFGVGVRIWDTPDTRIGGATPEARNVISGHEREGIAILLPDATGNHILGNYIGTDATGTAALGNGDNGVLIYEGANQNTIGPGNVISNHGYGIQLLSSSDNQIYNNNFIDNTIQAYAATSRGGNILNLEKPIGGNYWSDWTNPDADSDGFVDDPYVFTSGVDYLPWARQDGWLHTSNVYYVDTVYGDDDNGGLTPESAFATIQNGIEAAADGEVVLVYPGVYQEEIDFLGKALTVQGVVASPAGVPVIQNPDDFAVSFYSGEGPDSILKNFIVRDSFMGVFIAGSSPTISNLTIVGNKYGIEAYADSEPDISNTILWNNTDGDLFQCRAWYSCVERGGEGDITADPLFVDPGNGDYRLRSERGRYWPEHDIWVLDEVTSPCIDAGDPNPGAPGLDEPMPNGCRINIGAYGGTPQASLSLQQLLCLPSQASDPSPANGAVGVETDVILSWTAGLNAVSHDVYFGVDNPPLLVGNQTTTQFNPGMLDAGTTYFWRIDEINSAGKTTGEVWTFVAGFAFVPPPVTPPPKGRVCFISDTGVWLDGVLVPISKVGLRQSRCAGIGRIDSAGLRGSSRPLSCPGKVEKVQEHEGTFVCYDVLLESGNCISVVECHYFLVEYGRWIAVQDLKAQTRLQTPQGSIGIISVTRRPMPYVGKVYNLRIQGSDWYLVGEDAVIVRDY